MIRILKWAGIGLGTLLIGLLLWYLFVFDWDDIKDHVAAGVGERTRRDLSIGKLDVDLSLTPTVRFEHVRLENAPWSEDPHMVEVGSLEFTLRLLPLLRGRVVVPRLHLDRPRIVLERSADGIPNWDFVAGPAGEAAIETAVPEERGEFPVIGQLRVTDGFIAYRDPTRDVRIESRLETAVGLNQPGAEQVRMQGEGRFEGLPFALQVTGASLLSLREADEPYPLQARVRVGETRVHVVGTARDPVRAEGLRLRMELQGPDLAEVFPVLGIPLPSTRPYRIAGTLSRDRQEWRFQEFSGTVGESDLSGDLMLDLAPDPPYAQARLVSRELRLSELASFFALRPRPQPESERLIPELSIDFDRLRAMDMDVEFRGERVVAADIPAERVSYRARLRDGRLAFHPLRMDVADGTVSGQIHLDAGREPARLSTELQLRHMRLGRFLPKPETGIAAYGTFGGRIRFEGSGEGLRQVLAGADGGLWLSMDGGAVDKRLIAGAGLDVPELLRLVGADATPVPLRCSVVSFDLDDGRLRSNVIVIDAEESTLFGEGTVNLQNERLDLRIEAEAKEPSVLTLGGAIEIDGTLRKPSVGLDLSGAVGRAGAAAALSAILPPLAAILPFIDPGAGEDAACNALFAKAGRSIDDDTSSETARGNPRGN